MRLVVVPALLMAVASAAHAAPSLSVSRPVEIDHFPSPRAPKTGEPWAFAALVSGLLERQGTRVSAENLLLRWEGSGAPPVRSPSDRLFQLRTIDIGTGGEAEITYDDRPKDLVDWRRALEQDHPILAFIRGSRERADRPVLVYGLRVLEDQDGELATHVQFVDAWPGQGDRTVEAEAFFDRLVYAAVILGVRVTPPPAIAALTSLSCPQACLNQRNQCLLMQPAVRRCLQLKLGNCARYASATCELQFRGCQQQCRAMQSPVGRVGAPRPATRRPR